MPTMDEHGGPRNRLGSYIRQRRIELGLSVRRAAQEAGVDRDTWTAAESGKRSVHAHNASAIERVLRWAPGSADRILAGGEPEATTRPAPPIPGAEVLDDPLVAQILAADLPDEDKAELVHLALKARRRADEATAETLQQRVTAWRRWLTRPRGDA